MEVRFVIFCIYFENVEERLNVFFLDEFEISREGDSEDGDDCSFLRLINLFPLISDEIVPHMCKRLRLDDGDLFAD